MTKVLQSTVIEYWHLKVLLFKKRNAHLGLGACSIACFWEFWFGGYWGKVKVRGLNIKEAERTFWYSSLVWSRDLKHLWFIHSVPIICNLPGINSTFHILHDTIYLCVSSYCCDSLELLYVFSLLVPTFWLVSNISRQTQYLRVLTHRVCMSKYPLVVQLQTNKSVSSKTSINTEVVIETLGSHNENQKLTCSTPI